MYLCTQVDILFEDEKGFWAAIYEIIASTKRPIVMTSNGKCIMHVPGMYTYMIDTLQDF